MVSQIFIRVGPGERRLSLLENGKLVRAVVDRETTHNVIDGIYLGRVCKVSKMLDAAFVDIGNGIQGFLSATQAQIFDPAKDKPKPISKIVFEGKQAAILNFGARLDECKKAREILEKKGINISIIDARFAKPLDEKLILELASNHELILTIEEGSIGGFGSHVMKLLSDRGVFDKGLKFRSMFLPDIFIDQDTPEKMYEKAGLSFNSIVQKIEEALKSNIIFAKNKNKLSN